MKFINASGWTQEVHPDFLLYYVGEKPPRDNICKNFYHPFAWIKINTRQKKSLAARDHFGQEPFYYLYQDNEFIFGSTLPDILKLLEHKPPYTQHLIRDCFARKVFEDLPLSEETYFKGIYRLKPGHYLHIEEHSMRQAPYWELDHNADEIHYKNDETYVQHFASLLDESILSCTKNAKSIAAEFSGGVDSTLVFTACNRLGLNPHLYTQTIPHHYRITEEARNVQRVLEYYNYHTHHQNVDAANFEPLAVLEKIAVLYASPPPYLLGTLMHNLHQKIVSVGHDLLLSGHGGDELVSHIFAPPIAFPQRFKEDGFYGLWCDLKRIPSFKGKIKYASQRIAYSHRHPYHALTLLTRLLSQSEPHDYNYSHPLYYDNLRVYEQRNMQGEYAHEYLMRIEYDSVLAKSLGFRYAYPLLYPPLIEFCFRLPLSQKINLFSTRWLARRYLSQEIPSFNFKTKGGSLAPNTMQKCRDYERNGLFDKPFAELPYQDYIEKSKHAEEKLVLKMKAYMLKCSL